MLSGRNNRIISLISSLVMISRVSCPSLPSNSANRFRNSASSRLTSKVSGRRAVNRGGSAATDVVGGVGRAAEEGVALGLVDHQVEAQDADMVPNPRLQRPDERMPQVGFPISEQRSLEEGDGQRW